jgi:pyruvate/2-oxoglutarate dehydrogenase complex dihydrolipoamide dehydrogenase (E3) component
VPTVGLLRRSRKARPLATGNTAAMESAQEFDLCVLGAGSAGFAAATTARSMGKSVAMVDGKGPLAGLCILRGCMPSKTLLRSAELAHLTRVAPALGVHARDVRVDVPEIVTRKDRIIKSFADEREFGIRQFPLFLGSPRFIGPDTLEAGGQRIRAERFVVATGSLIDVPFVPGLRETGYVTSDDVLDMTALPQSVIVLGGGSVGVELAQYLSRAGTRVTIVQRSATLLSSEDQDIGITLRESFEREGIDVRTGTKLVRVEQAAERKRVIFEHDGAEESVEAEEIFAALGRRPNVEGFGFETAGIEYDRYGVKTDRFLQTTNPRAYAAGDVTGSFELVHVAVYGGQLAARNAFSGTPRAIDYDLVAARAVFTDPQVAVAGLNERECVKRGIRYAKASYPFADLGKAITADLTAGFVKMLAALDGRILGVTFVGAEASDLIHEAIALIYFGAKCHDVMEMPHLHPTLAEIITYPAEELCERIEHERHAVVTP